MTGGDARGLVMAAVFTLLVATAGCGAEPDAGRAGDAVAEADSPLADCGTLAAPPPRAEAGGAGGVGSGPLPALTLPCFTGGEPVALADLAGPAVINLWASWCGPCRDELPVLQRYAEQMAGRVHVVGVVTQDTSARAAAFATDAGVTFPALFDRDGRLLAAVPAIGLPATLFVDADGQVRYLHNAELDEAALSRYADEHLGVGTP